MEMCGNFGSRSRLCENVMLFLFGGRLTLPTLKIIEYSAF